MTRLLIFIFFISPLYSNAQGQWVWMSGTNNISSTTSSTIVYATGAVYGTLGTASALNTPGSTYESSEWTDINGNFWMLTYKGHLWKYDPPANMWTCIDSGQTIVYGTKGVPAPTNYPGGRGYGAATWTDQNGMLWVWGGYNSQTSQANNELWKYDPIPSSPTYGQWTWMHGGSAGAVWGTRGIANPANVPPPKSETSCTWVDNNGDLWFFGGLDGSISYNDLWKYDIASNQWTWMSGSNTSNQPGVYGALGVPAAPNVPGARACYASWTDNAGDMWLFGGVGNTGFHNDLWKYSPATGMWTWMSGGNTTGSKRSIYGTQCVPSASVTPGVAFELRTRWKDDCDNFWMYGNIDTSAGPSLPPGSVLWKYNTQLQQWSWVQGGTAPYLPAIHGTKGSPAAANTPGARLGGNPWRTNDGLWMYGGVDLFSGTYSDLWKYIPDPPQAAFSFTSTPGCSYDNINFSDNSTAGCNDIRSQVWDFGDPASGANNTSTLKNPLHTFNSATTYSVTLIVSDCFGIKDTLVQQLTTSFSSQPVANAGVDDTICPGSNAVLSGSGGTTYSWSTGSTSTTISINPAVTATYTLTAFDGTCSSTDSITIIVLPLPIAAITSDVIKVMIGQQATLSGSGGITYSWQPATSCITCSVTSVGPTATTTYTLIATDQSGCSSIDTITIAVDNNCDETDVFVPNVFSPNYDGQNDVLQLTNSAAVDIIYFVVFDRWGEKVFETDNALNSWDGKYKGKELNTAVFTWLLKTVCKADGKEVTGVGTLNLIK